CTKEARGYKEYLVKEGTLDIRQENHVYIVESFFGDMNGKRHKLTIREVDPNKAAPVVTKLLQILTTLTIFETNGVRKFVKFINYEGSGKIITTAYDTRMEESAQESSNETASNDTKTGASSKKTNKSANESKLLTKQAATPHNKTNVTPTPATAASKQKPNAKKPSATPKKTDPAYLHYGKTTEKIEEAREERWLERQKNKILGRKKRKKK
ncbi:hypothetical protein, partial [Enterococcus hulanensis]|uniref:hypothetical protein n=1 Tax=Enterococcus hulanensis TaxID=2559929 RepID=UPI0014859422